MFYCQYCKESDSIPFSWETSAQKQNHRKVCLSKLKQGSKEKKGDTSKEICSKSQELEDHTEVEVLTVTERNNSKSEDEHVMEPKGNTVSDEEAKKASGEKTSCSKGQSEYEKIRARNIKEREDLLTTLIADVSDYKRDAGIGSRKLSGKRKKGQCQFDNDCIWQIPGAARLIFSPL